jgi:hypothetical protein
MTRPIGFSTGALARDDVRRAVEISVAAGLDAIELSALRLRQLAPLVALLDDLDADLAAFRHVSFHVPSWFSSEQESEVLALLAPVHDRGWPLVVHPDVLHTRPAWRRFGSALLVENMDDRKPFGQTVDDLVPVFRDLPEARLCLDLAHARQVDPTLGEAERLLLHLAPRLAELHVSHVDPRSTHHPLTEDALAAYRELAPLIPPGVPVILESPLMGQTVASVEAEVAKAAMALAEPS